MSSLLTATLIMGQLYAQSNNMHMHHNTMESPGQSFMKMMDTMMVEMDRAPKGKSADSDFLQQMIPHHLGAVAMAKYEITHGKNFEMLQLAKSILAEQESEIAEMKILIRQAEISGAANSPEFIKAMNKTMAVMMDGLPANKNFTNTDQAFASVMLPHHQAAVNMAKAILVYGKDPKTLAFARALISNEQIEIEQMSTYIHIK